MNRFLAMFSITYLFFKVIGSLLIAWLSLGWKVRQARKAFEAELTKAGISKRDAERLSGLYSSLKDQMMNMIRYSSRSRRKSRTSQVPQSSSAQV